MPKKCLSTLKKNLADSDKMFIGDKQIGNEFADDFNKLFPRPIMIGTKERLTGKSAVNKLLSNYFDDAGNLIAYKGTGYPTNMLEKFLFEWQSKPADLRKIWKRTLGKIKGATTEDRHMFSMKLFKESAKPTDEILYRGLQVPSNSIKGLKPGDTFDLKGASGFSKSKEIATDFATDELKSNQVAVILETKGSTKATGELWKSSNQLIKEREVMVFADSAKVVSTYEKDGVLHIVLEVVQ